VHTNNGFGPNECKLMKKFDYDFNKLASLGHGVKAKPDGLNETQNKIHEQGGVMAVPKGGFGYVPSQPIWISGWCKGNQSLVQYITNQSPLYLIDCNLLLHNSVFLCSAVGKS